ncbi:unnamed protein product [Thlaspi arvense]|uniref:Cupin type-1 domain-containing protein n=1 Tax=Thlaspi arvense TaxID=13288 RepID=A0AAU9T9G9_THLAR|nr:unnamed protein product [Thlaspi arvense]
MVAKSRNQCAGNMCNPVFADNLPGLNTQGIAFARVNYAINGLIPPHTHPRASEFLIVQEGTLLAVGLINFHINVGRVPAVALIAFNSQNPSFVTSNGDGNRLFTKTLNMGDLFVFPEGLIHFQANVGRSPAVAFAALSSQNTGVVTIANTLFGSKPLIDSNVLARAIQLDLRVIVDLHNKEQVPTKNLKNIVL